MQKSENNKVYAGFFVRLSAQLIDSCIVLLALMVIRLPIFISSLVNPASPINAQVLFQYSAADIFIYLLGKAYYIVMIAGSGATVGKRLLNIKVVSATEEPLTTFRVIYRETIGKFLSSIFYIGYILIGADEKKRGLHDRLADTEVIYAFEAKKVRYNYVQPNPYARSYYGPNSYGSTSYGQQPGNTYGQPTTTAGAPVDTGESEKSPNADIQDANGVSATTTQNMWGDQLQGAGSSNAQLGNLAQPPMENVDVDADSNSSNEESNI